MKKLVMSIYKKIVSKETWKKVWYFTRAKGPSERWWKKQLIKEDIIPIILSIAVYVGAVIMLSSLFKAAGSCLRK